MILFDIFNFFQRETEHLLAKENVLKKSLSIKTYFPFFVILLLSKSENFLKNDPKIINKTGKNKHLQCKLFCSSKLGRLQ